MEKETFAPIKPAALKQAEAARTHWVIQLPAATKREDILRPDFWAHIASRLKPFELIEVVAEDGSFFAEYVVLSCDKTWAKLFERNFYDLSPIAKITAKQYEKSKEAYIVKHRGPKAWSVLRVSDNALMHEMMQTEDEAREWLHKFLTAKQVA